MLQLASSSRQSLHLVFSHVVDFFKDGHEGFAIFYRPLAIYYDCPRNLTVPLLSHSYLGHSEFWRRADHDPYSWDCSG